MKPPIDIQLPLALSCRLSLNTHITPHMNRDSQLAHPPQEFLMIIAPMPNIPRHIHKRLLRQNLAILPSPYLHELTLIPNLNQPIM